MVGCSADLEAELHPLEALQAGTSHDLGQTFSKSAKIKYQSQEGKEEFAWTTSWGMSTRTIGGLIMTHGDDDGVIMPPKVAPYPIVIIPFIRDEATQGPIIEHCQKIAAQIKAAGYRAHVDTSADRSGNKIWTAVKKGVPLRVEIGEKEIAAGQVTCTRRDLGRDSKQTISTEQFLGEFPAILQAIQDNLLKKATAFRDAHVFDVKSVAWNRGILQGR
jgi:prolyl-tRNA synthetase